MRENLQALKHFHILCQISNYGTTIRYELIPERFWGIEVSSESLKCVQKQAEQAERTGSRQE